MSKKRRETFHPLFIMRIVISLLLAMFLPLPAFAQPESIDQIRKTFKQPGKDYSTGPLWTWNDLLTEKQIRSTMQDMAKQHVKQVWVHPRPGLMTPYLGDDWFKLWGIALNEAEKLDMNVWIYDENSYPSGFAGGFVPEAMPDSRLRSLEMNREKELAALDNFVWYVFKITKTEDGKESFENVTAWAKEQGKLPAGNWLVCRCQSGKNPFGSSGWFGGFWYVDLLKKGVTEKFLEVTLEPYRKHFGNQFGKRIPGSFTDEPNLVQGAGRFLWNEEFPQAFEQKFGYSIIDNVPSLITETGDWKKVRHDYDQLRLDLFIERWAKPYHDYCEKYGLEFTGHYWEHGWPNTAHGPDNMAMYAWHQRPAIDTLCNQYSNGVNAQFGNARSVKELASAANQMGRSRTLSETYGAGGWDLRFEDMKRIADWQYALGINTTNEHLSYVTLRGARKRDHPQSFSYHAPWWEAYHVLEDYHTRLQYVLSRGEQINHVLVIEPTTTAWMYQGHPHLGKIGKDFQQFVHQLEEHQYEYDLGSEDIIARWGKTENDRLVVGKRSYETVILPANTENINGKVLELLKRFVKNGGKFAAVSLPERVDGKLQPEIKEQLGGKTVSVEDALEHARQPKRLTPGYSGFDFEGFSEMTHHMRRTLPEGDFIFLCNTDIKEKTSGKIAVHGYVSVEQWHPESGIMTPYPFEDDDNPQSAITTVNVELPPCGSILLFMNRHLSRQRNNKPAAKTQKVAAAPDRIYPNNIRVKRNSPNVLTLDYVDIKAGGEERKDIYTYQADQWVWKKHGFGKNPFDNEVQFRDRLLTKTFPADSGFSAVYRFTVTEKVPSPLYIVLERPDLYTVTCNGKPLRRPPLAGTQKETPEFRDWYLDKSFGKMDITSAAKVGENEIVITAQPLTIWSNVEPAYLLGDFSLEPAAKGFVVKPAKTLTFNLPEQAAEEETHSAGQEGVSWLTSGIDFSADKSDRAPYIIFDLGQPVPLGEIRVWNYNETGMTKRGVKEVKIYGSAAPVAAQKKLLGTFVLEPAGNAPQKLPLPAQSAAFRYLTFEILSNHNGVSYPVKEGKTPPDNGFAGLSEVKFFGAAGEITGVNVAEVSSELTRAGGFDRKAVYTVDGSGLSRSPELRTAWDKQGMPFYMDGVSYTETFSLKQTRGKHFSVQLGKWYGSVAKVSVNGKEAGFIYAAPWELDVSDFVKNGRNEITVTVIGTPKNLLGPHHNGKLRGTAWPRMFQTAPPHQPSGSAYDFIRYGLFEPFTVKPFDVTENRRLSGNGGQGGRGWRQNPQNR